MRSRKILSFVVVCLLFAGARAEASTLIYNLGTIVRSQSYGYAINASDEVAGQVADSYSGPSNLPHGFAYTGSLGSGTMSDLGNLGGEGVFVNGINASGKIVGGSATEPGGYVIQAFLYTGTPGQGATMLNLGCLGTGNDSFANAINNSGEIVGYSGLGSTAQHAILYTGVPGSGGAMHDLGTLSAAYSYASALSINNRGQIVGNTFNYSPYTSRAFEYNGTPGAGGAMSDLGTLGGSGSAAESINDSGLVTGWSNPTGSTAEHAFLYAGAPGTGTMVDLGTLGGTTSIGYAINSLGQIVGYSTLTGGTQHAFLYTGTPGRGGQMIDLDAWLKSVDPTDGAMWTLTDAQALTDGDMITGYGTYNNGNGAVTRAFVLNASALLPEPSVLASVVISGLFLRRNRVRKKLD